MITRLPLKSHPGLTSGTSLTGSLIYIYTIGRR